MSVNWIIDDYTRNLIMDRLIKLPYDEVYQIISLLKSAEPTDLDMLPQSPRTAALNVLANLPEEYTVHNVTINTNIASIFCDDVSVVVDQIGYRVYVSDDNPIVNVCETIIDVLDGIKEERAIEAERIAEEDRLRAEEWQQQADEPIESAEHLVEGPFDEEEDLTEEF